MSELITLAEFKASAVIEHGDDDDLLRGLISAAHGRLETFVGRPIEAEEITEYHDGGKTILFLAQYPISETADFTLVDTHGTVGVTDDETIDADYYRIYYESGYVKRTTSYGQVRVWSPGARRWKVTYTGGLDQLSGWESRHRAILAQGLNMLVGAWYDLGAQGLSDPQKMAALLKMPLPPAVENMWDSYKPLRM